VIPISRGMNLKNAYIEHTDRNGKTRIKLSLVKKILAILIVVARRC